MMDPLNINDRCNVRWRGGEQVLTAVIVERRPLDYRKRRKTCSSTGNISSWKANLSTELTTLPADKIEYYVHYVDHDRRLDEWIKLEDFVLETLERGNSKATSAVPDQLHLSASASADTAEATSVGGNGSKLRRSSSHVGSAGAGNTSEGTGSATLTISGGNWHGNSGDPALAAFEREHEETTKVKNIEKILMGEWEVEAWYYSPFPDSYSDLETLYVCEFCLTYMKKARTYKAHRAECCRRCPPGLEIYREKDLAVYELDGKDHRAYCQKLCLLAKLFLDHKTLYYDVNPFYFYVITRVDEKGAHIVGYFSKEKVSSEGYNLACILTFPQYQKSGYGKFIISLSYELSKREQKTGSPEKPLSDLGKVSYRSYWTHILMHLLADHDTSGEENQSTKDLSISDMSTCTGIKSDDILSTLQALDMIKVWKGQHVVYVEQNKIQAYLSLGKQMRLCKPECLTWSPPELNSP